MLNLFMVSSSLLIRPTSYFLHLSAISRGNVNKIFFFSWNSWPYIKFLLREINWPYNNESKLLIVVNVLILVIKWAKVLILQVWQFGRISIRIDCNMCFGTCVLLLYVAFKEGWHSETNAWFIAFCYLSRWCCSAVRTWSNKQKRTRPGTKRPLSNTHENLLLLPLLLMRERIRQKYAGYCLICSVYKCTKQSLDEILFIKTLCFLQFSREARCARLVVGKTGRRASGFLKWIM